MLVGEEMLDHFRNSTVAVIGVGGVGGYAAEMIVRAGIGHLIILDSDDVSLTNKNRQLLALDSTVGRPKCDVLAERLMDINPELDLVVIKEYLEAEKTGDVLGTYKIDFLVDAIDTLSPKLHLIKYCMDSGKMPCDDCYNDIRGSRVVKGYFLKGDEPKERCTLHKSVVIDTFDGLIADVTTPSFRRRMVSLIDYIRHETFDDVYIQDSEYFISSRKRK